MYYNIQDFGVIYKSKFKDFSIDGILNITNKLVEILYHALLYGLSKLPEIMVYDAVYF